MQKPAANWVAAVVLATVVTPGCQKVSKSPPSPDAGGSAAPASTSAQRASTAPLPGERISIPGGSFFAGSVPGEPGRRPEIEPRRSKVQLGPFQMDRLPYPNDPGMPHKTNVTREQASRLCAERGSRLCTELEWERACRGPQSRLFSTGERWDVTCEKPSAHCATDFDILAMGSLREWTASDVVLADDRRKAAARGGTPGAGADEHRCAHRVALDANVKSPNLGFRCCKGAKNAAIVAEPREGQTYVKQTLTAERLHLLLEADPATREIAKDIRFFREPDAANTVISRGPGDRMGFLFTVAPLLWNPVAGAEFLVVPGRSGDSTSFVVVFHVLAKDEYRLASSFIMRDEVGPVALAYNGYIRPRLHFSTCWGCPGETGKILYRDPDAAVIVQP